jgi:hypothetical protein
MRWRGFAIALAMGVVLGAPLVAGAVPFVIDQQCSCGGSGSYLTFPQGLHFGQEFTPALPAVQVVELNLDEDATNPSTTLTVNIRSGTAGETLTDILSAPILGTGSTVIPANSGHSGFYEVDLASPVTLTPGNLYVIDATDSDTSELSGPTANTNTALYSGGRGFADEGSDPFKVHGDPSMGGLVLFFQEGPLSTPSPVPEPASLLLFGTGLTIAGFAWRRHQRP